MKKLMLSLDELRVDSFNTTPEEWKAKGTVIAEQQCTCYTCTCPGCPSCDPTCEPSCWETCDGYTCMSCFETCEDTGCTKYRPCVW